MPETQPMTDAQRFAAALRHLVTVPKEEVCQRNASEKKRKQEKR